MAGKRKSSVSPGKKGRKSEVEKPQRASTRKSKGRKSEIEKPERASTRKSKGRKSEIEKGGKNKGKGGKHDLKRHSTISSIYNEPSERMLPTVNSVAKPLQECEKDPCLYPMTACCKAEITCRPNQYPGLLEQPAAMAVAGSESGTYDSLCKLLRAGLRFADRVLALTPWGNYVIFRCHTDDTLVYFLFNGCTCNANRFRYWDLHCGTAGLLYFENLHHLLKYMVNSRDDRMRWRTIPVVDINEMCGGINPCALVCN